MPIATNAAMKPPLALPAKPSLAVLPFQNLSGDPEQEYFVDGVVEEIITAISRLPWLFVIARNSSFAYKGKSPDLRQVGRELGVRYVLEGSLRNAGNRVRITGQLIDTTTGAHIWPCARPVSPKCSELLSIAPADRRINRAMQITFPVGLTFPCDRLAAARKITDGIAFDIGAARAC